MLKLRFNTEDWREIIEGFGPESHDPDQAADDLCNAVLRGLTDAGVEYERAHQQSVGSWVIVQSATPAERDAFDRILQEELDKMMADAE